jgi:hypothetical protein
MFFYKKRHKKHKNRGKCNNKSNCIKEKKRFGLTPAEMDGLISQMIFKPRITIENIK